MLISMIFHKIFCMTVLYVAQNFKADGLDVTLGLLVPISGPRALGQEVNITIEQVVESVNNDTSFTELRNRDVVFNALIKNTECDTGTGLYQLVHMLNSQFSTGYDVHAIIGPVCDDVCKPAGLLMGKWGIPMISFGCAGSHLNNFSLYPTFVRVLNVYTDMIYFILDILNHYGWDRVLIAEAAEDIWTDTAEYYEHELQNAGLWTEILAIHANQDYLVPHIRNKLPEYRVFILCAYGKDVVAFLCACKTLGILNGNYVFITIDFDFAVAEEDIVCPIDVTDGILDVTFNVVEDKSYTVSYQSLPKYNGTLTSEVSLRLLSDAVYLYATALNKSFADGFDMVNATEVVERMKNTVVSSPHHEISMDERGSRETSYVLHNFYRTYFKTVAINSGKNHTTTFLTNVTLLWPGGKTATPLGRPQCGWDGEFCVTDTTNIVLISSVVSSAIAVVLLSILVLMIFLYIRRKNIQEQLNDTIWKIPYGQLDFKTSYKRAQSRMTQISRSSNTILTHGRGDGDSLDDSNMNQIFAKTAKYNGNFVAIKRVDKPFIDVTLDIKKEINQVRNLKQTNVNPLVGACVESFRICLVTVYCSRGSLQDVLENDHIKLDRIFKMSFASDITKGMIYLHHSAVGSHGRLKSSNVFIDSHWICKVGDIAMPLFRNGEECGEGKNSLYFNMLWTAPELLREPKPISRGTPKGDVYAFGIILQEILLRVCPYGNMTETPEEIIERVIKTERPPFRPEVKSDEADEIFIDLMRICWEEIPMFRPSFETISHTLRKANSGKNTNLVDQMIHMMEKYADHLEELVDERTQQLEEEQKKTDELLCRMLPKSIADDLKIGKTIAPESFECVTIFFSDIVQFTALASKSTAMEIVNFLNDLYTCFDTIIEGYDVYKVETIGDAYMVVSGMPVRNKNKHAGEVATMALNLLSSIRSFKIRHRPSTQLQLRIGMHSGPVAAGVVGLKMPRYCLFGDTVNHASRMESSGLALRIHVSEKCKEILDDIGGYLLENRGMISIKGKGMVQTFFLTGKYGYHFQLPDLSLAVGLEAHEFK